MNRMLIAATLALAAGAIAVAQSPARVHSFRRAHVHLRAANPEDLVLVPNTRWMLASGMAPGSGLHLVDTRAKTVKNLYRRRRRERARRSRRNTRTALARSIPSRRCSMA